MKVLSQNNPALANQHLASSGFSKALKIPAQIISILTHPFFIPLIGVWIIVQTHFYAFAGFDKKAFISLYGSIITNTLILPFFTVFMLDRLKFISSISMPTKRDRIIPYIALMTFYIWTYLVFKKQIMMPDIIKVFLLGNFIAAILGFFGTLKIKTSMHTVGMGCLIGLLFCFFPNPFINSSIPLMIVFLITGLVATARMIIRGHDYKEIYLGLLFGICSQLLAYWII